MGCNPTPMQSAGDAASPTQGPRQSSKPHLRTGRKVAVRFHMADAICKGRADKSGTLLGLLHLGNPDISRVADHAESVQQPDDDRDDDDGVEDALNRSLHRDVGVDEPEQHANDDKSQDDRDEGHKWPWV